MPDGLFDDDGSFQHLPSLHDEDVEHVLSKTIRNIVRTCGESILGGDETEPSALGLLDGQALVPLSSSPRPDKPPEYKPLTAREQGFTLHAATRVAASNPRGLFRLCACGARGAIASSRLSRLPHGTLPPTQRRSRTSAVPSYHSHSTSEPERFDACSDARLRKTKDHHGSTIIVAKTSLLSFTIKLVSSTHSYCHEAVGYTK